MSSGMAYFGRNVPLVRRWPHRDDVVPYGRKPEDLARNLRRIRILSGYTQAQLAREAGLSARTLSLIETGKSLPRLPTVAAIAVTLECSIYSLWGMGRR